MQKYPTSFATILVMLSSIGFGTVPFFAKSLSEAGMASPAIAFYRYALTALALLPFLSLEKTMRMASFWGIVAGAGMGMGWIGYVKALDSMTVSTLSVIYMTYPLFTVLIAWLGFRNTPDLRSIFSAILIFLAAIIALSPTAIETSSLTVLLFAFLAPLGFGFAINILTNVLTQLPLLSRIACVSLGSVLGLTPLMVSLDTTNVLPTSAIAWWFIAGLALLTALIPQLIYTISAPLIGATRTAMAGSIELPTMFVVGWLAFGEPITLSQSIAGVIVLTAILIPPRQNKEKSKRT